MADRVLFATKNDTATPANSSGFNGFPYKLSTGSVGVGTNYPVGLSHADAVRWVWGIKTFDATVVASISAGGIVIGDFTGAVALLDSNLATTEKEIITYPGRTFGIQESFFPSGNEFIRYRGVTHGGAVIKSGGLYYPALNLQARLQYNYGAPSFGTIDLLIDSINQPYTGYDAAGTFTGQFNGQNVTMYYWFYDGTFGSGSFSITSFTSTVTAYWPYAASDASPIYNTSTGAQLQDPLN